MIKNMLRHWLFAEDVNRLEKLEAKLFSLSEANEWLIDRGRDLIQYKLNNPNLSYHKRPLARPDTAAKMLGIKSLKWEKQMRAEARTALKRMSEATGVTCRSGKLVFNPRKNKRLKTSWFFMPPESDHDNFIRGLAPFTKYRVGFIEENGG